MEAETVSFVAFATAAITIGAIYVVPFPAKAKGSKFVEPTATTPEPQKAEGTEQEAAGEEEVDLCRICLQGMSAGEFLSPCQCRGTLRYVHKTCLREWQWTVLAEEDTSRAVRCSVCNSKFQCGILARPYTNDTFRNWWCWGPILMLLWALLVPIFHSLVGITEVPELRPGMLLVATQQIRYGIFHQSVVLLVEHSRWGAKGYVLNKPMDGRDRTAMPLQREGGPVQRGLIGLLLQQQPRHLTAQRVAEGIWHSDELPRAEAGGGDLARERQAEIQSAIQLNGYAGWSPHQLESEVVRGAWRIAPGSKELLFNTDVRKLWQQLTEALQVEQG